MKSNSNLLSSLIIIIMLFSLLFLLIISVSSISKEPILQLALSLNSEDQLETSFSLGPSQVRVQLDLNQKTVQICCKNKEGLVNQIYYFMINPFRTYEDYNCHESSLARKDTAKFSKIGPITVNFNEIVYPICQIGQLGFSKSSDFLQLLPKNQQYFVIERQMNKQNQKRKWKLRVGGSLLENFITLDSGNESQWALTIQDINFNQMFLGTQRIIITSERYQLFIPKNSYGVIFAELTKNFECVLHSQTLYCPCIRGISKEFPPIVLNIKNNRTFKILPQNYLFEEDQICRVLIKETASSYWSINFMMLHNTDLVFHYGSTPKVGFASHKLSIESSDSIKQPLQIILNSIVILLMCLFVAMILIQIIKHFTGLQSASCDSFENYMLKHSQE